MLSEKLKSSEKKLSKREHIINIASQLFSSKKYHEVMMDDIAKTASIAKGTLYNYFQSKDDLYFSIMLSRMENLINSLNGKIVNKGNPIESLYSFVVHNYMFMMKYQCFFRMYQRDNIELTNPNYECLYEKKVHLRNLLIDIIGSGVTKKIFGEVSPAFSSEMIIGSIYSAVERGIREKINKYQIEDEREKLFRFILKGISSEENTSRLSNKKILVTRDENELKELKLLELFGVRLIAFPVINIVPVKNWTEFDKAVTYPEKIDYIIFTSANAVELFNYRCTELKINLTDTRINFAVTGSSTAVACHEFNIPVNIIPDEYSAEGLVKKLSDQNLKNKTVFIPGSKISRTELPEGLKKLGAKVNAVSIYSVEIPDYKDIQLNLLNISRDKPELFVFTSPSSFKNFINLLALTNVQEYFNGSVIAAIGPSTKKEIEMNNLVVNIIAEHHSLKGLFNSIVEYYLNRAVSEKEEQVEVTK